MTSKPVTSARTRPGARAEPLALFEVAITDPRRLHAHIDALAARANSRRLDVLEQDGVRFTDLLTERDRFVALTQRALADASYRPGRARLARAFIAGKWRDIARLGAIDVLVHAVVSDVLGERLEPTLSPRVYSYRKGRSSWNALRWFARVARDHRRHHPDPRTRGIYVLRTDIAKYAPSIPLHDRSALWPELRAVCGLEEASPHWEMLRALVLQPLDTPEGESVSREVGVLFGAPTSNVLMNMYLTPLDQALQQRGAYARFGDDVLFAHEDPERVREARVLLEEVLAERELSLNEEKVHVLFWNGAARSSAAFPEARGVDAVPFLGGRVRFDGTISLPTAKWRTALRDLRARIRRTALLLEEDDPLLRAKALAAVVNEAFDPRSELALDHRPMLGDLVSDRRQLAQLDYLVARWIAEAATGRRGPGVFRDVPYRWLRREAGLASRVVARDRDR